jgi:hypothetical protein
MMRSTTSEMIGSASASEYESEFWMSLMVAMKVKLRATSESDAAHVFMRRRKRSIGENSRLTHSARWARRAKQLTGGDTRHDAWAQRTNSRRLRRRLSSCSHQQLTRAKLHHVVARAPHQEGGQHVKDGRRLS